jgi:hypothetical protein
VHHRAGREGAQQCIRVDVVAVGLDSKCAVRDCCSGHQPHTEVAQISLAGLARRALTARRYERRRDVVAHSEVFDAFADLDDDAGAFMAAEHGKGRHRDVAGHHVVIGMAQPHGFHLDLHLALARFADFDLFHRPRLIEIPDQCALCFHRGTPLSRSAAHVHVTVIATVKRYPACPASASPRRVSPQATISSSCSSNQTVW